MPRPFSATYAVTYRGIGAGTITFDFAHDAATGRYIYETHASPTALARLFVSKAAMERSVMEIDDAGTRPIDWQLDDGKSGKEDDGELHFDWSRKLVTGVIEGETGRARRRARHAGPLVDLDRRHDCAVARRRAGHDPAHRRQPHQALRLHEEGNRDGRLRARQARHGDLRKHARRLEPHGALLDGAEPGVPAGARRADPQGQGRDRDDAAEGRAATSVSSSVTC